MATPRRRLRRFERPSDGRYLTCSCYHRLALLGNDQIKDAFVEHLRLTQQVMGFELFAWVVMPEHFHLLLRPARPHTAPFGMLCGTPALGNDEPTQTVTQILRRLKSPFARQVIERWRELDAPILKRILDHRDQPRFWQPGGGYDRNIVSDDELLQKIEYIHANPLRRGLVERTIDYRWSSARFFEGESYDGPTIARID